jgi:hypothetical protein
VSQPRTCSVYFFDGWIGVAPTVIGLSQVLAQSGYGLTIYCPRESYAETGSMGNGVCVRYVDVLPRLLKRIPRVRRFVNRAALFLLASGLSPRSPPVDRSSPGLYIGVDDLGILAATLAARRSGGQTVYLSLEIETPRGVFRRWGRWLVRRAFANASCVVVQDHDRFAALSGEMRCAHPHPFFVPNSPTGVAESSGMSNLFRDLLPLPIERFPTLVLHAGTISDVVYSQELASAFNDVGPGCALIFHDRAARAPDDPYLVNLVARNSSNLFLSLQPVAFSQIDRVFASASVGLAFYRPIDANHALIAKASGKLAFHLKHGTPMIMNDLPSLVELNERYGFGTTVHDPSNGLEMREAVDYCVANYERLSENARRCFRCEFQLETKAAPFADFVRTRFPP